MQGGTGGGPRTVCIVNPDCNVVEETLLEGSGYRLRKATSGGGPDLLFSCGSSTVACLLLLHPAAEEWARVERVGRSFRQSLALLPHSLLGDAGVLEVSCRLGCAVAGLLFVNMPAGASPTQQAAVLAEALLSADAQEREWQQARAEVVQSCECVNHCLLALPQVRGPAEADDLRTMGSLRHICMQRPEDIAANAGIAERAAQGIAAFFASTPGRRAVVPGAAFQAL